MYGDCSGVERGNRRQLVRSFLLVDEGRGSLLGWEEV
jgi:hypothetical protein